MSDSIADIVNGVVDGSLSDEQVTDWLRNIFAVSYTHLTLPTKA